MPSTPKLNPPPATKDYPDNEMWIDEQLWGHRLYRQSPRLIFLEFLTVAEACLSKDQLLRELEASPMKFRPYQRMHLRAVLFRSDEAFRKVGRETGQRAWDAWFSEMAQNDSGLPESERDFSYLSRNFPSFEDFEKIVKLLRSTMTESDSNKRVSSRFIFPFGDNGIYEDVNVKKNGALERDYINFGRSGELLYLMACRSGVAGQLRPHLTTMIQSTNRWNKVLASLQPPTVERVSHDRTMGYLPYRTHPTFDCFGEDWLSIFSLELPDFDPISHLITLGAFHLFLYHHAVAHANAQHPEAGDRPYLVCEIVAPKKTLVRERSRRNFQINELLSQQAVTCYLNQIEQSSDWQAAKASSKAGNKCLQLLRERVWWSPRNNASSPQPDALFAELRRAAAEHHTGIVGRLHRFYGTSCGLVSSRGTNRMRYAPNDSLLKTLVAANVPTYMEYREFLARLNERYGLILGEHEAKAILPDKDFETQPFVDNAHRLEMRLNSLGMLRRLSDSCAYVRNPFVKGVLL